VGGERRHDTHAVEQNRFNVEVLVTFNLKDFPEGALKPFDIEAVHPDDFLLDQLDLYPAVVMTCLDEQVNRYAAIGGVVTAGSLLHVSSNQRGDTTTGA